MENAGCVTHNEDYVFRSRVPQVSYERRAVTILHEMAHMWFGDLVTMTWWNDLWLNESFAEYASTLAAAEATQWTSAWTTFANTDKTWAYRQDQLPSTHPIAAEINDLEDVEVNFDGITYAKGAAVLKQLAAWVGRDEFLEGIRRYFDTFAWGNTTLADLLGKLEETSGRDLKAWSAEWLETAGVNTLRSQFTVDDEGRFTSFAVLQEAPEHWPTLRSHRLAIGLYDRTESGELVLRDRVELDVTGARTEVAELLGRQRPDVVLLNDDDLTYAKIRLDPQSLVGRDRVDRRLPEHPGPLAVLVGRVGHDPRRGDVGHRLRHAGAARHRQRERQLGRAHAAAPGRDDGHPVLRTRAPGRGPAAARRRPRAADARGGRRQRLAAAVRARVRGRRHHRRPARPGAPHARRQRPRRRA